MKELVILSQCAVAAVLLLASVNVNGLETAQLPTVSTVSSVTTSQETDPPSTNEPPQTASGTATESDTTSVVGNTASRTATESDTTSNSGGNGGSPLSVVTIAGSTVGAVIGLLLVMVMALVVFILALKCKRKRNKFEMKNPQYSSGGGKDAHLAYTHVSVCVYVATIDHY